KETEELILAKPFSPSDEIVSEVAAQDVIKVALLYHQELICSQTYVPWSHINLNLAGSNRVIYNLILVYLLSKWLEVKPIKAFSWHSKIRAYQN
ncbi:unnamed protein product, partial [Hymenolepis diminuta]